MSWWSSLYDDWLAEQLLVREPGEIDATLAFLVDRLRLAPGARVLDQCCGISSLTLPQASDLDRIRELPELPNGTRSVSPDIWAEMLKKLAESHASGEQERTFFERVSGFDTAQSRVILEFLEYHPILL